MTADARAFVLQHTTPSDVPLVPEIRLRQGADVSALWERTAQWCGQRDPPPPYWAFAWPGGQVLARFLLDHPELCAGRRVLDFGTGSGLVAIAAAMAGAGHVRAVDVDPLAVAACELNAESNQVRIEVDVDDGIGRPLPDVDLVLGGDVLYERAASERILPWLRALARAGKAVFLGDPERPYVPPDLLLQVSHELDTVLDLEGRLRRIGRVWRVPAPPSPPSAQTR
jgi:predicted nicotinamide N-methyase